MLKANILIFALINLNIENFYDVIYCTLRHLLCPIHQTPKLRGELSVHQFSVRTQVPEPTEVRLQRKPDLHMSGEGNTHI